ncbi:nucleotidyltransferase family protein [Sessilibacter corallicola]|uniref:nucleotidyltransferase family protein n=1 Tax=Sessilibacter corallicola TaxID=2904075 RepID=UPI001E5F9D38|nr:nucleotidyltransferase domain-containing protein [Sessilibacter corallicola]MCE2029338.1 nucleotidyltransferase domain-containing protein [Sessilibacter corallicola]
MSSSSASADLTNSCLVNPDIANLVARKLPEVRDLCIRFRVQELYLFGSAVDGRFSNETSDVDFLVDFGCLEPLLLDEYWLKLWLALQSVYARPVDLVLKKNATDPGFKRYLELYKVSVFNHSEAG